MVDSEPWATPGTLSLPNSPRPVPAVVLLAGSGPADRDATIGRNKIMKDPAWGLASQGIAALRFDKVTYTHRDALADVTDFTVVDEYVKPAVAAIQLLREHPLVDATRVFVLGHSQGGTVAPRIAAAEPSVAGLVILAGATQPMLILQGGRDYQVTVTDDLVGWQTGLADRPDVTIRVFPADNHLFFSGSGQSEPAEYEPAQHIDDAVVADVAQWIHQHADITCEW